MPFAARCPECRRGITLSIFGIPSSAVIVSSELTEGVDTLRRRAAVEDPRGKTLSISV
jgi:hypothetical protein